MAVLSVLSNDCHVDTVIKEIVVALFHLFKYVYNRQVEVLEILGLAKSPSFTKPGHIIERTLEHT